MLIIAPLDYERYAVLVSPLLVPGVPKVEAKQPPKRVEQLRPVSPASSYSGSQANEVSKNSGPRAVDVQKSTLAHNRVRPQRGPPPTAPGGVSRFPSGSHSLVEGQSPPRPQKVVELYEHPENIRGTVMRVSA